MGTDLDGQPLANITTGRELHCPSCTALLSEGDFMSPEIDCPFCNTRIRLTNSGVKTVATENQRIDKRCPVSLKVRYGTAQEFKTDYTRNVSRGGMFLATTSNVKVGTGMYLELFLPDLKEPIRLSVVVVHRQLYSADNKVPGIGVKFLDIDPSDRSKLINYLNSLPDCD